jgi:hypothetical protein
VEEKKKSQDASVRYNAAGTRYYILTGSTGCPSAEYHYSYRGATSNLVVPEQRESSGDYGLASERELN